MKRISKIMAAVLAICLLLSVCAFASEEASYVFTADSVVTERTEYPNGLVLQDASALASNDEYSYTLTVDGIETQIVEGAIYDGYCVITPTILDSLTASGPGGEVTEEYRSAIYIDTDGVNEDYSVLDAVQTTEDTVMDTYLVKDVTIQSNGPLFNGIKVVAEDPDATYTIENATIMLNGIGGDDFRGYGAGIYVQGTTNVLITGCYIENAGAVRDGIVVGTTSMGSGGSPVVTIEDTVSYTHSSDYDEWLDAQVPMMSRIPFCLQRTGNVRSTVALGTGEAHYVNCIVVSESWGVLSTDTGSGDMLYVTDTLAGIGSLEVAQEGVEYSATKEVNGVTYGFTMGETGEELSGWLTSGYVAFADGGINDVFTDCEFYTPDTVLTVGGNSEAIFNGGYYYAGTTGIFWYSSGSAANTEPTVSLTGTTWDVGRTMFKVRTGTPYIQVDDSVINMAEDGVLVQLYDDDDTNGIATSVMIIGSDGAPYYSSRDDIEQLDPTSSASASGEASSDASSEASSEGLYATAEFMNGDYEGDIYNAMTQTYITLKVIVTDASLTGAVSSSYANHVDLDGNELPTGFVIAAPYATDEEIVTGAQAIDASITSIDQLTEGVDYVRDELYYSYNGRLANTPIEAVNDPVELTLNDATWTPTGISYLTKLVIDEDSEIIGATMTVDGEAVEIAAGTYEGSIVITPV